jgi:hypothetical protein
MAEKPKDRRQEGAAKARAARAEKIAAMSEQEREEHYHRISEKRRLTMEAKQAPVTAKKATRGRKKSDESAPVFLPPEKEADQSATVPINKPVRRRKDRGSATDVAVRSNAAAKTAAVAPEELAIAKKIVGKLLSIDAVAAAFECNSGAIQQYLKEGKLKGINIAGTWIIAPENLKRFVNGE